MGVFSKVFKGKDSPASKSSSRAARDGPERAPAPPKKWADAWARTEVGAEEVQELLQVCTQELKSRALDMPFLLLPFRPDSDANGARTFIRNFFSSEHGISNQYHGHGLYHELKIIEPMVLCGIMKWCWSRLGGGVVGWNTYELFRQGEEESQMAKHSFDTFIPLSVESEARKRIVFDFFELLAAIAANGKTNGLGGRKLSRLAGWWAFDHLDNGKGFEGGYRSWAQAADATSHLFFAYLRALAPETAIDSTVSKLPRSLQTLLAQTEYPPTTPRMLLSSTTKVVMLVNTVSPTPFALLRRAKNFDYPDNERVLQAFSDYDDPVNTLTPECRRVMEAISSSNSTARAIPELSLSSPSSPGDGSWSRFEDMGFSSMLDTPSQKGEANNPGRIDGIRSSGGSAVQAGRPKTPSWADFLSSGFTDESPAGPPTSFLMSPDQQLPPLGSNRVQSSQSHVKGLREDNLEPGELASFATIDLDETFWWVWISSLASEEPPLRKAVFGRCAFVEIDVHGGHWLVFEEQIKSASSAPAQGAVVVEKKSRFSTFASRRTRRSSTGRRPPVPRNPYQTNGSAVPQSRTTIGPDQAAKIQAAALALVQKQKEEDDDQQTPRKRGRTNDQDESKTQSTMTLQPVILKEAGPAMQWARKFDKEAIRQQYLGDNLAGKGGSHQPSPNSSSLALATALSAGDATRLAQGEQAKERELPPSPAVPAPPAKDVPIAAPVEEPISSVPSDDSLPEVATSPTNPETPQQLETQTFPEGENTLVNNTPDHQILRKPVNSIDLTNEQHPALREEPKAQETSSPVARSPAKPTSPQSPAVVAAIVAARNAEAAKAQANGGPATLKANRKTSTRGFRNMFNKRKEGAPEVVGTQRASNSSNSATLPVEKDGIVRTPSFLRRKQASPTSATPTSATPVTPSELPGHPVDQHPAHATIPGNIDDGEPGPEVTDETSVDHQLQSATSDRQVYGSHFTRNPNESSGRFSDFSQGPGEDVPTLHDHANAVELEESVPVSAASASELSATSPQSAYQARLAELQGDSKVSSGENQPAYQTRLAALIAPPQQEQEQEQDTETHQFSESEPTVQPESLSRESPEEATEMNPIDASQPRERYSFEPSSEPEQITALPPVAQASAPVIAPEQTAQPAQPRKFAAPVRQPPPAPAPVESARDRWAQIRKNAADRKTDNVQRTRGNSSGDKSLTQSIGTDKTDEDETSGEDSKSEVKDLREGVSIMMADVLTIATVESRVARIKARVAELTGGSTSVAAR